MSIITIPNPQTKNLIQLNTSDVLGSVFSSQNLDIQENGGRMRVGKRMIVNSADTDSGLSDLYNPIAFVSFNNNIYTAGGASAGKVYKSATTSLHGNFAADASSNAPAEIDSRYSDMVYGSNGYLYATGTTKLYECNGGTWSATTRTLTTASAHMLTSYAGRIYVSNNGNTIVSASISSGSMGTLSSVGFSYAVQIGNDTESNTITFIRASASRIWIGTVNTKGGKGYVYEWDGQATAVTRSYRLESSGALSCVIKDEIPYIVDSNGDLLAWNGGTFTKLTGLNRENGYRLMNSTSSSNNRFIHPNGMSVIQGNVHLLINNMNDDYYNGGGIGSIENTIPSGVYEYTQSNGLVHKYGLGLSTSSGTIIDYGQNRVSRVGALQELIRRSTDLASTSNGSFLAGGAVYTDATTVKAMVWNDDLNDTLQKASTIVTPFIESSQVEDTFQKIFIKHKRLLNSSDKIVVKCRNVDIASVEATITWTSTTTFTVPNSSVVVSNYWTSGIGGEVEITQGLGSGKSAHITNAVLETGAWTVTVDETFTSATGTSKARFTNWTKLGTIDNQVQQFKEFPISADNNSIYIQFKVWFLATGKNEIHSLNIISKTHQSLV